MRPQDIKTVADVARWLKNDVEWSDCASEDCAIHAVEALEKESNVCAAYVLDRAEQYNDGSGVRAAFDELIGQFRESEHLKAYDHGELDDILKRWGVIAGDDT
jgi:hypothetical protein